MPIIDREDDAMCGEELGGAAMLDRAPDLSSWKDALHSQFVLRVGGAPVAEVVLEDVEERTVRPGWESFSLLFRSPGPAAFSDGTFAVQHPELGAFTMFVVAVHTPDGEGQQYQSVFYRPST